MTVMFDLFISFHVIGACLNIAMIYETIRGGHLDDRHEPILIMTWWLILSSLFGAIWFIMWIRCSVMEIVKTMKGA